MWDFHIAVHLLHGAFCPAPGRVRDSTATENESELTGANVEIVPRRRRSSCSRSPVQYGTVLYCTRLILGCESDPSILIHASSTE